MDKQKFQIIKEQLLQYVPKPKSKNRGITNRNDGYHWIAKPRQGICEICGLQVENPRIIIKHWLGQRTLLCGIDRSICHDKTVNKFRKYK